MKRRKLLKFISLIMVFCILLSTQTFAHSGRTDSSGGHRDNKNKSGLGYYHYHHGMGPHLHTNGVCPYDTSVYQTKSSTKSTNTIRTTTVKKQPKIGLVATDIKTFIDSYEVPTFLYNGSTKDTVIIAEDLRNYGFDKAWNSESRTLTITKNSTKSINPMEMSYYRRFNQGQYLFNLYKSDIKVLLKTSPESIAIEAKKVYYLNGYTAISTNELKNFGNLNWNNELRSITVGLNN